MLDRLEEWKIELWNRPVAEELLRIRNLKMTGQTEELYERWKQLWDTVLSQDLPDIEENLFDIENAIDRYQFRKTKKLQVALEAKLYTTENKLDTMMEQIQQLLGSEEAGREEIDQMIEFHQELRERLISFRNTFSTGEAKIEELLDALVFRFEEFESMTKAGDYLFARETMLEIRDELSNISRKMDLVPYYIKEVRQNLYAILEDLQNGNQVMLQQGYGLEHLHFDDEVKAIELEIVQLEELLTLCDVDQLEAKVVELKVRLQEWYDKFEFEVTAKRTIPILLDEVKREFELAHQQIQQLREDTPQLKKSIRIPSEEFVNVQELADRIDSLQFHFDKIADQKLGKGAQYSVLQGSVENTRSDLSVIIETCATTITRYAGYQQSQQQQFSLDHQLRSDFMDVSKMVAKSNIPGVSPGYDVLYQDAKEKLSLLESRLKDSPLDMVEVELISKDAKESEYKKLK
jgi:septation ring formation regulator